MLPVNLRIWQRAGERMAEPTLPVVDFGAFSNGTNEARQKIADRIDRACREVGFFYLVNHGIEADIFANAFDAAALFFALPQAEKKRIAIENSSCHRGWFALGEEALDHSAHPEGDYKEGVKIDLEPGDALIYRGNDVEHWREAFEGENCGQVFLHYNDASSEHAEENKYDTRPFLGLPVGFRKDERV